MESVAVELIRCNIVIKECASDFPLHDHKVLYKIPDCRVPPGRYSDHKKRLGRNDLDSARLTIHDVAWKFFVAQNRERLDQFEGTDAFDDGEREVIVYVMSSVSERALEDLVAFLAEKFGVSE